MKDKGFLLVYGLIILFLWSILSKMIDSPVLVPGPIEVFQELKAILSLKSSYGILFSTLKRTCISFLFSLIGALILGYEAYVNPWIHRLLSPILYFLKVVPVIAVIILILIWSTSGTAPIIVGFLMVFSLLYEGVLSALSSIDPKVIEMTKFYKVSFFYKIKDLYLPTLLRYLSITLSSAFGLAFKSVVAGEVLSQPRSSIGGQIYREKNYLNTAGVLAWLLMMVMISIALDRGMKWYFRRRKDEG